MQIRVPGKSDAQAGSKEEPTKTCFSEGINLCSRGPNCIVQVVTKQR